MSEFDCQSCGACCAVYEVAVSYQDNVPEELTTTTSDGMDDLIMQTTVGRRCIALKGEVNKTCSCSIYAIRPTVCRDYKSGTLRCRDLRRVFGIVNLCIDNERQ